LLGRKTWIHTVAHAGLSAAKVPDRQEIRSTPCVDDVATIGEGFCSVEPCSTGCMGSEPFPSEKDPTPICLGSDPFGNAEGL
ncbi:hypothetical protein, partial [Stenotrophomonas maltophilia]|uniref:hypothetical protein n=1 Tax=Stenotrophomonas maltophilia TaxID=40324 RepID=UPI001AA168DD